MTKQIEEYIKENLIGEAQTSLAVNEETYEEILFR